MIRHLPYFVVVAEEGNFQRASRRLNIAQSALSRRIRDLEFELGNVPLFLRKPSGVQLTPSGVAFLAEARAILDRLDEARETALAIMNGEQGLLRLGYSIGAVRSIFIADLLKAFRATLPRVSLRTELLPVEELQDRLRQGALEAAILYVNDPGAEFQSLLLSDERFLLAIPAGHRLAGRARIAFADINDEEFVWYARVFSPTVHQRMVAEFVRRGATPRISMESPTSDTTLQLVAAGFGLGFVPPVESERLPSGVILRPVDDFDLHWQFRMIWQAGNPSAVLPRLIEAVSSALDAARSA